MPYFKIEALYDDGNIIVQPGGETIIACVEAEDEAEAFQGFLQYPLGLTDAQLVSVSTMRATLPDGLSVAYLARSATDAEVAAFKNAAIREIADRAAEAAWGHGASGTHDPSSESVAPAASETSASVPASSSIQRFAEQRKATLDRTLQLQGAQGWRIETRSDFQATIAKGHRLNNTLHLILSILTFGLWIIVWIILAITRGEKRRMITIDEYGNVIDNKL